MILNVKAMEFGLSILGGVLWVGAFGLIGYLIGVSL